MDLRQLRIENLRLIESLQLDLDPGWNLFVGANGAGKTSLLEAAFLLSHGRSFRTSNKDALIRRGTAGYAIFGELDSAHAGGTRVGLARSAGGLEARVAGQVVPAAELLRHAAVVCFEPGSHELMSGAAEERRRFLDWGVFHVEHDFLGCWRRYQRALKQRNALLRTVSNATELDVWDHELAQAAEPLTRFRENYFRLLEPVACRLLGELLGELGAARFRWQPGYDDSESFHEVLIRQRDRDRARGHSGAGPHRADWMLAFDEAPRREHLSRGQEKLAAFAMVMAQAQVFAETQGTWPVICLDDVASEVDAAHLEKIVAVAEGSGAQVLVTGTQVPEALAHRNRVGLARFHVEQGRVTRLL